MGWNSSAYKLGVTTGGKRDLKLHFEGKGFSIRLIPCVHQFQSANLKCDCFDVIDAEFYIVVR